MPDPNTAISALTAGEIDYLQNPAMDTYPVLKAGKKVRLVTVDPALTPLVAPEFLTNLVAEPTTDAVAKAKEAIVALAQTRAAPGNREAADG